MEDTKNGRDAKGQTRATDSTATREFFVPAHYGTGPKDPTGGGYRVSNSGEKAYMHLMVPQDFTTITNAEVIIRANTTNPSMDFGIATYYGAIGEAKDNHSESGTSSVATTAKHQHAVDISFALASLAAGDFVLVEVGFLNNTDASVRGLRFRCR